MRSDVVEERLRIVVPRRVTPILCGKRHGVHKHELKGVDGLVELESADVGSKSIPGDRVCVLPQSNIVIPDGDQEAVTGNG
jgi:hypothetical protein